MAKKLFAKKQQLLLPRAIRYRINFFATTKKKNVLRESNVRATSWCLIAPNGRQLRFYCFFGLRVTDRCVCGRREKEEGVESENAIAFFFFPPKQIREIAVILRHSMTKPCFHGKKGFWTTDDAFPRKKIRGWSQ